MRVMVILLPPPQSPRYWVTDVKVFLIVVKGYIVKIQL